MSLGRNTKHRRPIGKKPKRRLKRPKLDVLLDEAQEIKASGAWDEMTSAHVVAVFADLHQFCYGVPAVLDAKEFAGACSSAGKVLRDEFDGDARALLTFVRWAWRREIASEQWRRDNDREAGRLLDWRSLFARRFMLTHWRVDVQRRKG